MSKPNLLGIHGKPENVTDSEGVVHMGPTPETDVLLQYIHRGGTQALKGAMLWLEQRHALAGAMEHFPREKTLSLGKVYDITILATIAYAALEAIGSKMGGAVWEKVRTKIGKSAIPELEDTQITDARFKQMASIVSESLKRKGQAKEEQSETEIMGNLSLGFFAHILSAEVENGEAGMTAVATNMIASARDKSGQINREEMAQLGQYVFRAFRALLGDDDIILGYADITEQDILDFIVPPETGFTPVLRDAQKETQALLPHVQANPHAVECGMAMEFEQLNTALSSGKTPDANIVYQEGHITRCQLHLRSSDDPRVAAIRILAFCRRFERIAAELRAVEKEQKILSLGNSIQNVTDKSSVTNTEGRLQLKLPTLQGSPYAENALLEVFIPAQSAEIVQQKGGLLQRLLSSVGRRQEQSQPKPEQVLAIGDGTITLPNESPFALRLSGPKLAGEWTETGKRTSIQKTQLVEIFEVEQTRIGLGVAVYVNGQCVTLIKDEGNMKESCVTVPHDGGEEFVLTGEQIVRLASVAAGGKALADITPFIAQEGAQIEVKLCAVQQKRTVRVEEELEEGPTLSFAVTRGGTRERTVARQEVHVLSGYSRPVPGALLATTTLTINSGEPQLCTTPRPALEIPVSPPPAPKPAAAPAPSPLPPPQSQPAPPETLPQNRIDLQENVPQVQMFSFDQPVQVTSGGENLCTLVRPLRIARDGGFIIRCKIGGRDTPTINHDQNTATYRLSDGRRLRLERKESSGPVMRGVNPPQPFQLTLLPAEKVEEGPKRVELNVPGYRATIAVRDIPDTLEDSRVPDTEVYIDGKKVGGLHRHEEGDEIAFRTGRSNNSHWIEKMSGMMHVVLSQRPLQVLCLTRNGSQVELSIPPESNFPSITQEDDRNFDLSIVETPEGIIDFSVPLGLIPFDGNIQRPYTPHLNILIGGNLLGDLTRTQDQRIVVHSYSPSRDHVLYKDKPIIISPLEDPSTQYRISHLGESGGMVRIRLERVVKQQAQPKPVVPSQPISPNPFDKVTPKPASAGGFDFTDLMARLNDTLLKPKIVGTPPAVGKNPFSEFDLGELLKSLPPLAAESPPAAIKPPYGSEDMIERIGDGGLFRKSSSPSPERGLSTPTIALGQNNVNIGNETSLSGGRSLEVTLEGVGSIGSITEAGMEFRFVGSGENIVRVLTDLREQTFAPGGSITPTFEERLTLELKNGNEVKISVNNSGYIFVSYTEK